MSYGPCIMSYFGIHHSRYPYSENCSQLTKHAHTHADTHTLTLKSHALPMVLAYSTLPQPFPKENYFHHISHSSNAMTK